METVIMISTETAATVRTIPKTTATTKKDQ